MADVEGKYTRSLDELKEARNQIDNLQSALNDKERQVWPKRKYNCITDLNRKLFSWTRRHRSSSEWNWPTRQKTSPETNDSNNINKLYNNEMPESIIWKVILEHFQCSISMFYFSWARKCDAKDEQGADCIKPKNGIHHGRKGPSN